MIFEKKEYKPAWKTTIRFRIRSTLPFTEKKPIMTSCVSKMRTGSVPTGIWPRMAYNYIYILRPTRTTTIFIYPKRMLKEMPESGAQHFIHTSIWWLRRVISSIPRETASIFMKSHKQKNCPKREKATGLISDPSAWRTARFYSPRCELVCSHCEQKWPQGDKEII